MKTLWAIAMAVTLSVLSFGALAQDAKTKRDPLLAYPTAPLDAEILRSAAAIQQLVLGARGGAPTGALNLTARPGAEEWQCTGTGKIRTACDLACRIAQDWGGCACSSIEGGCECDCD